MRSKNYSGNTSAMLVGLVAVLWLGAIAQAGLIISTTTEATLGGVTFECQDLVHYDPVTGAGTSARIFDGSEVFSIDENLYAAHLKANGHLVLSPENESTIGDLTFMDSDLIEYDPVLGTATMVFDGSELFGSGDAENISAVSILDNGHIVLSTTTDATLAGLSFECQDLVEYDPVAGTATLFFDGSELFSLTENIDAAHVLPNGNIILSTETGAKLGGLTFRDGDLVEYDPIADTAVLIFNEDWFTSSAEDIAAVTMPIPEPGTVILLVLGSLAGLKRSRS